MTLRSSVLPSKGPKLWLSGRQQTRLHFLGLGIFSPSLIQQLPAYAIKHLQHNTIYGICQ
jgi:hypothetical protein